MYKDPDGRFKLNYNADIMAKEGVTQTQLARFTSIVNNISNLVANNPQALEAISNTTGFSREQIMHDLSAGNGPTLSISAGNDQRGGRGGIFFGAEQVKQLGSMDKGKLSNQVLGLALGILHEYGHYGDQTTNNGKNSGQYEYDGKKPTFSSDRDAIRSGNQKWKISLTGHRGNDIEVMGFGVMGSVTDDGTILLEKTGISDYIKKGTVSNPPSELPSNAQGTNILNTLDVK